MRKGVGGGGRAAWSIPRFEEGALEEAKREAVNERILEDGGIRDYVTRISQLISGGRLKVAWRARCWGRSFPSRSRRRAR